VWVDRWDLPATWIYILGYSQDFAVIASTMLLFAYLSCLAARLRRWKLRDACIAFAVISTSTLFNYLQHFGLLHLGFYMPFANDPLLGSTTDAIKAITQAHFLCTSGYVAPFGGSAWADLAVYELLNVLWSASTTVLVLRFGFIFMRHWAAPPRRTEASSRPSLG
jgi:hypothetical protein